MTLYADKDIIRYTKGAELDTIQTTWTDPAGAVRDFFTGWTFTVRVGSSAGMLVEKTTGFTGAATAPNLTLAWTATDLDPVPSGSYQLDLIVRNTGSGLDLTRSWLFQMLPGVGIVELAGVPLLPEIASSDPAKMPISTAGGITTLNVANLAWTPLVARRTSDLVRNNTAVLADDTVLTLPVASSATYELFLYLLYTATDTADLNIAWSAPSGASLFWAADSFQPSTAAGAASSPLVRVGREVGSTEQIGAVGTTGTSDRVALPRGILVTSSTPGNLTFRWAQFTAEVSDATVWAGSTLILQRLA